MTIPRLTDEQRTLVEENIPLAEWLARRKTMPGVDDPADVRSDALLGLTMAATRWEPDRGPFRVVAWTGIEAMIKRGRQVRSGVSRPRWERGDRQPATSLDVPLRSDREESETLLSTIPDRGVGADVEASITEGFDRLQKRDRLVMKLRLKWGLTQAEIGPLLGVSQIQVSRIERRAKERLRDVIVNPARA